MSGEKILIVEDDAILAIHLQSQLQKFGFLVDPPVATGEDAINSVKKYPPDLILMDIQLASHMTGIEAAKKINEIAAIPIVYLSAYSDKRRLEEAKLTMPFGYLLKPIQTRELYTTLEVILHKHKVDNQPPDKEFS
ncbi:MAG TPA: response regulator [Methanospirillum sp.]|nr:response regulator [Methanospirillum sp.]